MIECLGLDAHFRVVIDLEFHDYTGKPFREAYERVIDHLQVQAAECVLVEDTPRNLRAAKELGMITVLVGPPIDQPDYIDFTVSHSASPIEEELTVLAGAADDEGALLFHCGTISICGRGKIIRPPDLR